VVYNLKGLPKGSFYLTQTMHQGDFVIRFQVGQFDCKREDVLLAVDGLRELGTKCW